MTTVAAACIALSREYLAKSLQRIRHCVDQLDDERLWWRPHPALNSIANLLLHLAGNLRQWIVSGVGGAPDERNRPAEFSDRSGLSKAEVMDRFERVVAEADAALARLDPARLLEPRRVQGFDETVMSAMYDSLTHLCGHVQEIVCLTRMQLGDRYRFLWTPSPDQGA